MLTMPLTIGRGNNAVSPISLGQEPVASGNFAIIHFFPQMCRIFDPRSIIYF